MFTHLSDLTKAIWFYIIAFGLVLSASLLARQLNADPGLAIMFTPLIAVLFMFFIVTRDGYSKAGWLSLGLHRAGFRSWGLALLAPVCILAFAYGVVWSLGVGHFTWPSKNPIMSMAPTQILMAVLFVLLATMGEEIGWRGYLLPRLLALGQTRALLVSGLMHGLFHLPLMLLTPFYHGLGNPMIVVPLFLLALTAAGVWYGYLRLTSQSAWPAAVAHTSLNIFAEQFADVTLTASPLALEYLVGESGVLTLFGIVLCVSYLIYRLNRQQPEAAVAPATASAILMNFDQQIR